MYTFLYILLFDMILSHEREVRSIMQTKKGPLHSRSFGVAFMSSWKQKHMERAIFIFPRAHFCRIVLDMQAHLLPLITWMRAAIRMISDTDNS